MVADQSAMELVSIALFIFLIFARPLGPIVFCDVIDCLPINSACELCLT